MSRKRIEEFQGDFRAMKNKEADFEMRDLFLLLFAAVAAWLLLFQSNLF
jgi:hypothetical protein